MCDQILRGCLYGEFDPGQTSLWVRKRTCVYVRKVDCVTSLKILCFFHKFCFYPGRSVYMENDPPFDSARRVDSPTPSG